MSQQVLAGPVDHRTRDGPVTVGRKIRGASQDEVATIVVKQGGRAPLELVLEEAVSGAELQSYVHGQYGWKVEGMPMSVDGTHYNAKDVGKILLAPTPATEKVYFGSPANVKIVTRQVEFRAKTSGHG